MESIESILNKLEICMYNNEYSLKMLNLLTLSEFKEPY